MQQCLLCRQADQIIDFYKSPRGPIFKKCLGCGFIFLSPEFRLTQDEEKERYHLHQNDVQDEGYQGFLRPVIQLVLKEQKPESIGLDYGCGPSSVVTYLLKKEGYQIEGYDPLYWPDPTLLEKNYDYVTCTEVAEHFHSPMEEFVKLQKLLKRGASLYIRTALTDTVRDFPNWHYHRDPTHTSFFSASNFKLIKEKLGFSDLQIEKNVITLRN